MLKRFALRIFFLLCAAAAVYGLTLLPHFGIEPDLRERNTVPLLRSATPAAHALACPAPDAAETPIPEPSTPLPEKAPPTPGDIFALMYHDLTEDLSDTSVWRTTPDTLRENLQSLLAMGYRPLSVEDYIRGDYEIGPDYFIVTFDDGYTSNLTLAEQVLRELGIPAALFVITGSTEMENHLSWDQLAELQENGVISVYSHTHTHADGRSMSEATFLADVARSWEEITGHLGEPEYKILSYPNGSYTRATMRALAGQGYELFVIQEKPYWFETGSTLDEEGLRILVRFNVAYDADIEELADLNRARNGLGTTAEKLEAIARAEAEALAAEREARAAWMESQQH